MTLRTTHKRRRYPVAKVKGGWTPEEDAALRRLVVEHGEGHWSTIARALNDLFDKGADAGRIGKQCRERWNHHLRPDIRTGAWTEEEEAVLVEAHQQHGNRWSDIARVMPGRTENAIKNHFNATLRRKEVYSKPGSGSSTVLRQYLVQIGLLPESPQPPAHAPPPQQAAARLQRQAKHQQQQQPQQQREPMCGTLPPCEPALAGAASLGQPFFNTHDAMPLPGAKRRRKPTDGARHGTKRARSHDGSEDVAVPTTPLLEVQQRASPPTSTTTGGSCEDAAASGPSGELHHQARPWIAVAPPCNSALPSPCSASAASAPQLPIEPLDLNLPSSCSALAGGPPAPGVAAEMEAADLVAAEWILALSALPRCEPCTSCDSPVITWPPGTRRKRSTSWPGACACT